MSLSTQQQQGQQGKQLAQRDPFAEQLADPFAGFGSELMDLSRGSGGFLGALAPLMRDTLAKAVRLSRTRAPSPHDLTAPIPYPHPVQQQAAVPRLALDVHEDAQGLFIKADVAGARKEDIDLSCDAGNVYISVSKPEAKSEQGDARVWRREMSSGCASRTLAVGAGFDTSKLTVECHENGVLCIRVPRAPGAPERRRVAL